MKLSKHNKSVSSELTTIHFRTVVDIVLVKFESLTYLRNRHTLTHLNIYVQFFFQTENKYILTFYTVAPH